MSKSHKERLRELRNIALELEEIGVTLEVAKRLSFTAQRKMMDHLAERALNHAQLINEWIRQELREGDR